MKAISIGGTADHLHGLLSLPATMSFAKAVQLIKGGSSKWIHDNFSKHRKFAWQEGYGAFSVMRLPGEKDDGLHPESKGSITEGSRFKKSFLNSSSNMAWNTIRAIFSDDFSRPFHGRDFILMTLIPAMNC